MKEAISLGKIFGIEIKIHSSWFIIFFLVTFSLFSYFSTFYHFPFYLSLPLGLFGALFLFASILSHELCHSLIAQKEKIPTKSITLFVFGGVAQITKEPETPFVEFKISIFGPLSSFSLSLFFWLLSLIPISIYFQAVFGYLALINLILGLFNLVPAFPLDGGRIFRSILWARFKNIKKATKIASSVSQVFAFLLIAFGFYQILTGNFIGGLWMIFIGWFLIEAASFSFRQVVIKNVLSKIKVAEIIKKEVKTVKKDENLEDLALYFLQYPFEGFMVKEGQKIKGIITLADLQKIERELWKKTKAEEVMTKVSRIISIKPANTAYEALSKMLRYDIDRLPVIDDGKLLGLVERASIISALSLQGKENVK